MSDSRARSGGRLGRAFAHPASLLLPGLLACAAALGLAIAGPRSLPWTVHLLVDAAAAAGLASSLFLYLRWRRSIPLLEKALRDIANGRAEARVPASLPLGMSGLAGQINGLGQQLTAYRDQLEQRLQAAAQRLRHDLESSHVQLREASRSLAELQAEFRQQSELFSGLTHELRTPLTAILGFADLLRKTRLDQDQGDYLATLDRSARGLLSMLNDVLDWSRIEAGRLKLQEERFDLADAVEDVIALLAPLAYEKQLELVHIVYHDVPLQLDGDAQRLRQILTNLLSNAIKFTEHGEVVLRVMKEREQGGHVWLRASITDTGQGMTAEQVARLFQPFEQVGGSSPQPGSGLGLTIVKKLAELMEGSVSVESEAGKGSTFSVLLRLGASPVSAPTWNRLRNRRIWMLETHPTAGLALAHSLQFWGIEVASFSEAAQLVARLRNAAAANRPDVVIAGLRPGQLADPAVQQLGRLCIEAQPPLLALLTSASPSHQQEAIDLGAARALPKSVSRLQLYRELCDLVRSGRSAPVLEGKFLLLADNNPANRRYLATLARELGAEVREARDGEEALRLWNELVCDFALLDYRMPGLDGLGVVRAIRAAETRRPRARLVATSAHLSPEEHKALREAGADEVLIKPFDEAQMLRALAPGLALETAAGAEQLGLSSRLAQDAELIALLREELPLQLREIEDAFVRGDAVAARAAAHTLNGTAAFYHLAKLKNAARDMEEQLSASAFRGVASNGLERLRHAVRETLGGIAGPP